MTTAEAEMILGVVEYYLVQVRKIQFLNKQRIEDFTSGYNKQIDIYKQLAGFLNKQDVASQVISNLANNIEAYFTENEKKQYGIGVPDAELSNEFTYLEGENQDEK